MSIYLSPECEEIIRVALAEREYRRVQELRSKLAPASTVFDDADSIRASGMGVRL